jgi:hypothetical protein
MSAIKDFFDMVEGAAEYLHESGGQPRYLYMSRKDYDRFANIAGEPVILNGGLLGGMLMNYCNTPHGTLDVFIEDDIEPGKFYVTENPFRDNGSELRFE